MVSITGANGVKVQQTAKWAERAVLLASVMLSLTTARAPTPESIPLREHLRLDAKTTLHYNSFSLLKMCPCTSYTGAHLTLSKKTPLPPREEVGNPAWVKTHSLFSQYVN